MNNNPIKRNEAFKPLSRDHHHGLLLCWKLKEGFKKGVSSERMKQYIDYFWLTHLMDHFRIEEKYIFPILGNDNELIMQALEEHRSLGLLFAKETEVAQALQKIIEELELHIRFEERVLFNKIQQVATEEQLTKIEKHHSASEIPDDWKDRFWE